MIGIINLTRGFAEQGHQVTVLSLNTRKHYFDPDKLPESIRNIAQFIAVDINTDINLPSAFINLFAGGSYNIERFYSKEFKGKIAEVLSQQQFDMILLEGIYLVQYMDVIRENSKATVVLRPQNVEHIIWERLHEGESNAIRRQYLRLLAGRMKKYEQENINKADILIPVSEKDMALFVEEGCTLPHIAIPTGYVFNELPAIDEEEDNAVAFIGGMDWAPNREGVEWFIDRVWGRVLDRIPDARFYIAGRNFPADMMNIDKNGVIPLGEVEDSQKFLLSKSILAVPLFAGSGMRVKVVEAMALGRAIVSTSIGAESLSYTHGKDILIADKSGSFALAIVKLLNHREDRMELGSNAQQLVRDKYDNRKICSAIIDFCKPYLN